MISLYVIIMSVVMIYVMLEIEYGMLNPSLFAVALTTTFLPVFFI